MDNDPRDRSFFWPIVLIGAGVIWLLANFGLIQDLNWSSLLRLWPLALIAAGLDMLFGRSHPLIGALIGLLTVGAAVALLVAGPRLGLAPAAELRTETFTEPLDGATAAEISLDLASYPTTVSALEDSSLLFHAEIPHRGQVRFTTRGEAQRQVMLDESSGPNFLFFGNFGEDDAEWRIGLSPAVPLRLVVDSGSGASELNLSGLNVTAVEFDAGSGAVALTLPAAEEIDVRLEGGSGGQTVRVPPGLGGSLRYEGGSGSLRVSVAPSAAVRVDVRDSGSGSVRVPDGWERLEGGQDGEGVWQSAAYDDAEGQALLISVDDLGSGQVVVSEE